VVLAAGLWLARVAGAGRPTLAAVGMVMVVLLVVVTRWEPSVLRAGVMAGLVLVGVATGRGPGGRRALCLAVVVLLLADPGLAGALRGARYEDGPHPPAKPEVVAARGEHRCSRRPCHPRAISNGHSGM
jgi:hypothetical protein